MTNNKFSLGVAIGLLMASGLSFSQSAQEAPAPEVTTATLEEVFVTARRRSESLQETPVAVSALSADDLTRAGIHTITDLQQSVPSLQFGESGSKTPAIFIRGIGQREGSAVLDPGVGVYINDIFIPRQDAQLLDTVDTQSIQVLRGPQGTLFGKNTTGGAILVSTREPNFNELEGAITTRVGNFGRRDLMLRGNIPLLDDRMGARFALNSTRLDGYLENAVDGAKFGDEDRLAATGRLVWDISESLTADVFGYWSRQDERSTALTCIFQNPASNLATIDWPGHPSYETGCRQSEAVAGSDKVSINTNVSVIRMDSSILALTLKWLLGDAEIKSITGYNRSDNIERNDDQDASVIPIISNGTRAMEQTLRGDNKPFDDEDRYQVSQELQFSSTAFDARLQYTLGAFASIEKINDNPFFQLIGPKALGGIQPSTVDPGLAGLDGGFVIPFPTLLATRSDLENKSWSVFGQGTYDVFEWLQFTLGGRYTVEERERDVTVFDVDLGQYCPRLGAAPLGNSGLCSPITKMQFDSFGENPPDLPIIIRPSADVRSETWNEFTPSATLSLIAPPDWLEAMNMDSFMTYFTYSKGFKAGGFEPRGPELVSFDPERVTNLELGVKMDVVDRRLRLNAAIYDLDYENIQVRVAEQGEAITDIFLFLSNAGKARVSGAELEATLLLNNWVFNASAGYTKARYDEFLGQVVDPASGTTSTVDRSDEEFALVPETTYSFAVQYNWLTSVGVFIPRLSYYFRDEVFTGIDEKAIEFESSTIDSFSLLNARLTWMPGEDLRLSAFVDNLLDEEYFASGFTVSAALGAATLVQGPQRTVGMEVSYQF